LQEKVEKYHIRPSNIYNFDEKGFLLGICRTMKRIISINQLRTKKLLGANQDGSREFISLLACICADGTTLPPGLIYQGKSGDLQDVWLEDFDSSREEAYFAVSTKGWTNEELGMSWLTKIFDPRTKAKAGNSKRLLLVDGHSSHVNLRFIDYCDENNIILGIFPPHSTHRLQPLDVGIFSPLATAYSKEIDHLIQSSSGFSRMTKRLFWRLFRTAWQSALTLQNIRSSFASAGIYPFNPSVILNKVQRSTPSPPPSDDEKPRSTPNSVRAIRRTIKAISKEGEDLSENVQLLIRATEKLSIQNEILRHDNRDLYDTLVQEKKRRKRGKPMGLFDKENPGEAQFFSPSKVEALRQRAKEIEAQKEQEKLEIAQRRTEKALVREQKAQELQEKKEIRARQQEEKRLQKKREKEDQEAMKLANQQLRNDEIRQKKQRDINKAAFRDIQANAAGNLQESSQTRVTHSGRSIRVPVRYQN